MPIITSRSRDLNSRGKGSETYRMLARLEDDTLVWADKYDGAIVVSNDWCRVGYRANERRCSTRVEVPAGLLVLEIEKSIPPRGVTYSVGLTIEPTPECAAVIRWHDEATPRVHHVGVKKSGTTYKHIIEIDGVRREFRS